MNERQKIVGVLKCALLCPSLVKGFDETNNTDIRALAKSYLFYRRVLPWLVGLFLGAGVVFIATIIPIVSLLNKTQQAWYGYVCLAIVPALVLAILYSMLALSDGKRIVVENFYRSAVTLLGVSMDDPCVVQVFRDVTGDDPKGNDEFIARRSLASLSTIAENIEFLKLRFTQACEEALEVPIKQGVKIVYAACGAWERANRHKTLLIEAANAFGFRLPIEETFEAAEAKALLGRQKKR